MRAHGWLVSIKNNKQSINHASLSGQQRKHGRIRRVLQGLQAKAAKTILALWANKRSRHFTGRSWKAV